MTNKLIVAAASAALVGALHTGTVGAAPLTCAGRTVTTRGTTGNDNIRGTAGVDVINALAGNDVVHGLTGRDVICGGPGHDRLYGEGSNDRLFGNDGNDGLWGGPGTDALNGGVGHDLLDGGTGSNTGLAGPGTDTCLRTNVVRGSSCEPTSLGRDFVAADDSDWDFDDAVTADVNGRTYRWSLRTQLDSSTTQPVLDQIEYNLSRRYRRLTVTVGLDDNVSETGAQVLFEVYGDGPDPLWSRMLGFGQSATVAVDVTNVLRLKLRSTAPPDGTTLESFRSQPVFGSPYVSASLFLPAQN